MKSPSSAKTKSPPPPVPGRSPARPLQDAIERAEAAGVKRGDMKLHLTRRDVVLLKRDAEVALSDISFADGVMSYVGVAIEQGGVAVSELVLPAEAAQETV
ncbi:MAG TPA: hypothetical protein VG248_05220 [Caulobacteraceae bacterium]|jgi:hypothetical protein|nr:hypothetical protein [Caulobacteraceae bacterium]